MDRRAEQDRSRPRIFFVREQARVAGRTPDPIEPEHVFSALVEPDISLNEMYRRFKIGRTRQKAVKEFAAAILALMDRDGYGICRAGLCDILRGEQL